MICFSLFDQVNLEILETASLIMNPREIQAMYLQGIFTGEYFQSNSNPGSLDRNEVPAVDPG